LSSIARLSARASGTKREREVRRALAAQSSMTFIAAAVAEWRKLVAEVRHAFACKRNRAAIDEKRIAIADKSCGARIEGAQPRIASKRK